MVFFPAWSVAVRGNRILYFFFIAQKCEAFKFLDFHIKFNIGVRNDISVDKSVLWSQPLTPD